MTTGAGRQLAAQHSHSLEGWYAHIPGIRVVAPATIEDARGMLWTALWRPRSGAHLRARQPLQRRTASSPTTPARPTSTEPRCAAAAPISRSSPTAARCRQGARRRRRTRRRGHRRRGDRPADAAAARHATPSFESVARTHRAVVVDEGWRTRQPRRRDQRARSPRTRSTTSTLPSAGSAAPRCRSRTPSTSRRRRSRRCRSHRRRGTARGRSG